MGGGAHQLRKQPDAPFWAHRRAQMHQTNYGLVVGWAFVRRSIRRNDQRPINNSLNKAPLIGD